MIGRRIESHPRFPWLALACLAAAIAFTAAGAAQPNVHLAVVSVPFWLAAGALARARGRAVAAVGFIAGVAWLAAGAALPRGEREGWFGVGFLFATVWGLIWFVFFLHGRRGSGGKPPRGASLVISPDGLALVQGDLRGE